MSGILDSPGGFRPTKRRRLNFACNYCRSRKTRCDEGRPSCKACTDAGIACVTQDRRRPHQPVERREAGTGEPGESAPAVSASGVSAPASVGPGPAALFASGIGELQGVGAADSHVELEQDAAPESWPKAALAGAEQHSDSDEPPDASLPKFSGVLPLWSSFSSVSCLDMLTGWFDLALHRLGHRKRFRTDRDKSPKLTTTLPLTTQLHSTPGPDACQELLERYLRDLNAVFPIVDEREARHDVAILSSAGPAVYSQSQGMYSLLRAYLIVACGAICCGPDGAWDTFVGDCLALARQCLGQLIGQVSVEAVHSLFLLSVCLRYTDDLSSATATIDLCVSVARSAGLHRSGAANPTGRSGGSKASRRRVWLAIYCYEKLLSFELGRSSCISDGETELPVVSSQGISDSEDNELLSTVLQLSTLLSDIGKRYVQMRIHEEKLDNAHKFDSNLATEKVKVVGECGLMLTSWAESVSPRFRPTTDLLCTTNNLPAAAFISIQYNLAVINMMRNSLLISPDALRGSITHGAKDKPWEPVIRNGQTIAANSARRIVRLLTELEDYGQTPLLPTYGAPLHALYVLVVHLIRKPQARSVKSDSELIQDAAHFVRKSIKPGPSFDDVDMILKRVLRFTKAVVAASSKMSGTVPTARDPTSSLPGTHDLSRPSDTSEQPLGDGSVAAMDAGRSLVALGTGLDSSELYVSPMTDFTGSIPDDPGWLPGIADELGCDWADFATFN